MDCKENQNPLKPILKNSNSIRKNKPHFIPLPLQESPLSSRRTISRDINFSRKRLPKSPIHPPSNSTSLNEAKRYKSNNSTRRQQAKHNDTSTSLMSGHDQAIARSPTMTTTDDQAQLQPHPLLEDEKSHFTRTSSEIRASRFREAPMRDSPSAKPPSLFMRVMPRSKHAPMPVDPSAEHFMEQYEEEQKIRPSLMQTARSASRATQLSGLTHHANTSISSNTTGTSGGGESSQSRESGLFKLGKSVKDAWHKVTLKSKDPKESVARSHDPELVQRQIRAEMEYATLKKQGHIGTLKAKPQSTTQRDSGVDMTIEFQQHSDLGQSFETLQRLNQAAPAPVVSQRASVTPGKTNGARFHFRTPSLQDLKRITSQSTLHRRTASAAVPVKNEISVISTATIEYDRRPNTSAGFTSFVRSSRSRTDMTKEDKLAKKVFELENKLNAAKQQLEKSRSMELLSAMPVSEPRPKSQANPEHRQKALRFKPLPTLQSESLLIADTEEAIFEKLDVSGGQEKSCASVNEPLYSVETPKKMSESWLQNGTPGSAFDSSSEDSPEGIFNALRRKSFSRLEESPVKKAHRRNRPKANLGSIDRSTISKPIFSQEQKSLVTEAVRRTSLDTVSEEASIVSARRHQSSKVSNAKRVAFMPEFSEKHSPAVGQPRPKTSHQHRHARSMSPVKITFHTRPMTALPGLSPSANQFQHYRSRSMSPPLPTSINFSRPVTPGKLTTANKGNEDIMNRGKLRSPPRLAPSRENWEWPEDVF